MIVMRSHEEFLYLLSKCRNEAIPHQIYGCEQEGHSTVFFFDYYRLECALVSALGSFFFTTEVPKAQKDDYSAFVRALDFRPVQEIKLVEGRLEIL